MKQNNLEAQDGGGSRTQLRNGARAPTNSPICTNQHFVTRPL